MLNEEFHRRAKALKNFIASGDQSLAKFQTGGYAKPRAPKAGKPAEAPTPGEASEEEVLLSVAALQKMGVPKGDAERLVAKAVARGCRTAEQIIPMALEIRMRTK